VIPDTRDSFQKLKGKTSKYDYQNVFEFTQEPQESSLANFGKFLNLSLFRYDYK